MDSGRFPFAALTEAMGPIYDPKYVGNQYGGNNRVEWIRSIGNPVAVVAQLAGVSRRTAVRWSKDGIPSNVADQIACTIGLHVSLIWPEWFTERE